MTHPVYRLLKQAGLKSEAYSGRGMYGQECLAVIVDFFRECIAAITKVLLSESLKLSEDDADKVVECMESFSNDNMGFGVVIYFPWIPPPPRRSEAESKLEALQMEHDAALAALEGFRAGELMLEIWKWEDVVAAEKGAGRDQQR